MNGVPSAVPLTSLTEIFGPSGVELNARLPLACSMPMPKACASRTAARPVTVGRLAVPPICAFAESKPSTLASR